MAEVDYFLKVSGIEGEAEDAKHKGEIQIRSWEFCAQQAGSSATGGGGSSGRASLEDFRFMKTTDTSSPKFHLACCSGEVIKEAVLTCRKAGKDAQEYLKITLSDIVVTYFKQTGGQSGSGDRAVEPMDEVLFDYAKIQQEYKPQKGDGTLGSAVTAGWDVKANAKT